MRQETFDRRLQDGTAWTTGWTTEEVAERPECALHNQVEAYGVLDIQCFECKHVYQDGQHIVDLFNEMLVITRKYSIETQFITYIKVAGLFLAKTLDDVPFCPLCLHDW